MLCIVYSSLLAMTLCANHKWNNHRVFQSHLHTAAMKGNIVFVKREQTEGIERHWYQQVGLEHAMIVPLMVGTQSHGKQRRIDDTQHTHCVGFLFVNYPTSTHQPSQGHYAFAQDIATQCALAIEKNRILDEAHQAATLATERANTLDGVLNAMNEGIIVLDMEGQVIVNNSTATHFLGVPQHSTEPLMTFLQRQSIYTLDGDPLPGEDFPIARALRGIAIRGERFINRRTDGSERAVE